MKLIIPEEVEQKIHDYVMSVPTEIAGMGKVSVEGDTITVEDVMIYEQDVTGATADLSPQALAKWQTDLVRTGGSPRDWKLWWHSHANMSAFFSGRDTATIDAQSEGDWMVSLVVNKKREREARLDTYRPFRMFIEDIDIQIGATSTEPYTVPADIAEEVARKVKQATPSALGFGYAKKQTTFDYAKPYKPEPTEGDDEPAYTRDQLAIVVRSLEDEIDNYTSRGLGDSAECLELSGELIDAYYDLAEAETDEHIADTIRAKAIQLENIVYALDYAKTF